jgi:hypothetical protein
VTSGSSGTRHCTGAVGDGQGARRPGAGPGVGPGLGGRTARSGGPSTRSLDSVRRLVERVCRGTCQAGGSARVGALARRVGHGWSAQGHSMTNGDEERAMNGGRSTNGGAMAVAAGAVAPGPGLEPAGAGVLPAAERLDGGRGPARADGERSNPAGHRRRRSPRGALPLRALPRTCRRASVHGAGGLPGRGDDLAQETCSPPTTGSPPFAARGRCGPGCSASRAASAPAPSSAGCGARRALRLVHDSDRAPPTDELIARRRRAERAGRRSMRSAPPSGRRSCCAS